MEEQRLQQLVRYLQSRVAELVATYELEIGILRTREEELSKRLEELESSLVELKKED